MLSTLSLPPAASALHFQPPGWAVPMTMLQPTALADDGTSSVDEAEAHLTALRCQWHALLGRTNVFRVEDTCGVAAAPPCFVHLPT